MHLVPVPRLVVLGAHVVLAPEADAERQVGEAPLQRRLDRARVDLEGARVQLDAVEAELARRLASGDRAVVQPGENWRCAAIAARREKAEVLLLAEASRVAEVERRLSSSAASWMDLPPSSSCVVRESAPALVSASSGVIGFSPLDILPMRAMLSSYARCFVLPLLTGLLTAFQPLLRRLKLMHVLKRLCSLYLNWSNVSQVLP